jgi:hypothetical protein
MKTKLFQKGLLLLTGLIALSGAVMPVRRGGLAGA